MIEASKNSFDLLRLFAAAVVLFSHQHVLLGQAEPTLFGWSTLGGLGVSIFFYLSGFLVWSSWSRDPNLQRFFIRRSLRIFPALWLLVALSVLVMGPILSTLSWPEYFASSETWRYLGTALLVVKKGLPSVFSDNPYPAVFNGSLWTLPVEFLCYVSVAIVGSVGVIKKQWVMTLSLGLVVISAAFGSLLLGNRFITHLEMVAFFWWGVMYGFVRARPESGHKGWTAWIAVAFIAFLLLGSRGVERSGLLVVAMLLVLAAQHAPWGSLLTDRMGDLSYGVYIFAFPVQQIVVAAGRSRGWTFTAQLSLSFLVTIGLAYISWHMVEKRALLFKPKRRALI